MSPSAESRLARLISDVARAADERVRRETFARGFDELRAALDLHPQGSRPSLTLEAAAATASGIAAACLPLGLALVMHLYPLCALRFVPLPWWSPAQARRARLLREIDGQNLLLANAGSERAAGAHVPAMVTRSSWGMRVEGRYDYVSLANVADLVLFSAPLARGDSTVFCVASLRADSTRVGAAKFGGNMRLSDTCPVSFEGHLVREGRYLEIPTAAALSCMTQYQRSWFQLLLADAYLARIARLREAYDLPLATEDIASLNELAVMREYALRLLDEATAPAGFASLNRVTTAIKLRVSWQAQAVSARLRVIDAAAASELGFLRLQPTSDDRIVRELEAKALHS